MEHETFASAGRIRRVRSTHPERRHLMETRGIIVNPKLPTARHAIIGAASLALVAVCAPGALGRSPDHTAGVAPPALAARIDARQVPTSERLPASSSTFTYLSNELADVSAAKLRLRDFSASRDSLQALTEPTVRYPGATGKASAPALTGSTGSTLARGLPFPSDGRIDQSGAFGLVGVWDGFPYTGWVPASPQVAAGPRQLVATVNSRLRVFNKDGALESSHSLRSWFAPVLEPMGIGGFFVTSPWVVYDEREARFVITAVANRADGLSYILLAVSHDDLATGDWCVYGTDAVLDGADRGVHYAANPRAEVNIDAVVVTANMFSMFDGRFGHAKARLFPKSTIYERSCSGGAAWADIWGLRDELGEAVRDLRPVRTDSDEHVARFVNAHLLGGDSLTLWSLRQRPRPAGAQHAPGRAIADNGWGAPLHLGADGKQPGTATRVSTGSASLHTAVQRGRSMWTSHTVGCTWPGDHEVRACTRWYEIDLDSGRALQDGTFGQPGDYVFHGQRDNARRRRQRQLRVQPRQRAAEARV